MNDRRLPDAKGWYLTADHARLLRYDGYTWTAYTTDGDETELNDGYSTTADPDLLIRTLGAHRLPLTRLGMRQLRRGCRHILRHMPLLRLPAVRAQADDGHGSAVWHDRQRILQAIREHWTSWPSRNKETATPDQRACQMAKQLNKEKS